MERATYSVLFYIKRAKRLKNGQAPVYLRITLNGKSAEISLKRSVDPGAWDTNGNRAKGKSDSAKALNEYLISVRSQVRYHHQLLQEKGGAVTAGLLRNAFLGIGEKHWTLKALFTEHNYHVRKLVGRQYSPLTLKRFEAAFKHVLTFMKFQYNTEEIAISQVDHKFITSFEFYLKTKGNCQHNSAMNHIKALKKIVRNALANDYIRKDPFASYRISIKPVDRGYLTEHDLETLDAKELPIGRVAIVRDLFLFQCYTGLAYTDLASLTEDHIQIGIDRKKWIYTLRGKTDVPCHIPLLPKAEEIINRYAGHPCRQKPGTLLPVPSNQNMNAYLKEVGDLCGIKQTTTY